MKLFGLMLIVVSSAICGLNYANDKKSRINTLQSYIRLLELMRAELCTYLSSLPELINKIDHSLENKALAFAKVLKLNLSVLGDKDFCTIWQESFRPCCNDLHESEIKSFLSLGNVLGKFDVENQIKSIDECLNVFRDSEKKDLGEYPQLKRLSLGVSVSVGALVAIVLI